MNNKKRMIIISVSVIIALIIIGTAIYFSSRKIIEEKTNESSLSNLYEKMMQDETYQITFTLNDKNKYSVARKGNTANVDTYKDGTHTTDIIKDGNTYLLMYNTKKYYMYQNNEIELTELTNELQKIIQNQQPTKGEEEIDGKKYKYEEYKDVSYFLMNADSNTTDENINTRFYFKGDDLKYIKTIIGNKTELIKVDVSYNVDENIFKIPSDFEEG